MSRQLPSRFAENVCTIRSRSPSINLQLTATDPAFSGIHWSFVRDSLVVGFFIASTEPDQTMSWLGTNSWVISSPCQYDYLSVSWSTLLRWLLLGVVASWFVALFVMDNSYAAFTLGQLWLPCLAFRTRVYVHKSLDVIELDKNWECYEVV